MLSADIADIWLQNIFQKGRETDVFAQPKGNAHELPSADEKKTSTLKTYKAMPNPTYK